MSRPAAMMIGVILLLPACRDLGLPGNIPTEEARRAEPPDLVAQVMAPADDAAVRLVVDGRLWVPVGPPRAIRPGALRPVGATAGQTVYARTWDDRPYGAIFTRAPMPPPEAATTVRQAIEGRVDHWQEYGPVIGRPGQVAAPARLQPDPGEGAPATTQPDDEG
jgi:hypothetical protein